MDTTTLYPGRPGGRIGYDLTGSGPLVVLIPGMGDLRQTYRHVIAAAMRSELISGLALRGPFVRGEPSSAQRLSMRVLMAPAWAASVWKRYLPRLYAGTRPADFDAYVARVADALRRPGFAKAFSLTTRTGHGLAEASIPSVAVPSVVLMGGELDPDFPAPRLEAEWIAEHLGGEAVMIADAGHDPQSQQPGATLDVLLPIAARATADA